MVSSSWYSLDQGSHVGGTRKSLKVAGRVRKRMRLLEAKQGQSHIVRFALPWTFTSLSSFDCMRGQKDVDLDVVMTSGGLMI